MKTVNKKFAIVLLIRYLSHKNEGTIRPKILSYVNIIKFVSRLVLLDYNQMNDESSVLVCSLDDLVIALKVGNQKVMFKEKVIHSNNKI